MTSHTFANFDEGLSTNNYSPETKISDKPSRIKRQSILKEVLRVY